MPQARKSPNKAIQEKIDAAPKPDPNVPVAPREPDAADLMPLPSASAPPPEDVAVEELTEMARAEAAAWCRLQLDRGRHASKTSLQRLGIGDRKRHNVRQEILAEMANAFDPPAPPRAHQR